jgi:putative MFS transporter
VNAESSPSIATRLERLPISRVHRRFITLISLGGWFDFYDIFMVAYLGAALRSSGFLDLRQMALFVSAGFVGMFVGAIVFGAGSDRMGRRTAFIFMLLIYSIFTLAGALAPSAWWLIVSRALAGIGIGAEVIVIDTYVTEVMPSAHRGRYVAITQAFGFTAIPTVALLSYLLIPTHVLIDGWRWVMIIGGAGALLAWYLRRGLSESPRWLESHGRAAEADAIVSAWEKETGGAGSPGATSGVIRPTGKNEHAIEFADLWKPPLARRMVMLIVFQILQTIGLYGWANWLPTLLVQRGVPLVTSLLYTFLMAVASPLGPLLAVLTSDRFERKWTIVVLALVMAVVGLVFLTARAPAAVIICGAALTMVSYWFSAAFHAYQAELFPTRVRGTAVGVTYSWSRLSAAVSSIVIGALLSHGVASVVAFITAAWLGVAVIIAAMGTRTNAIPLEAIAHES